MNCGEGVETHGELLINPLTTWVGQNVARVAVHPGEPGDLDGAAGFFGDFAHYRSRGGFPDIDATAGQLSVQVIGTAHQQNSVQVVTENA
jgi:hypothetical protein